MNDKNIIAAQTPLVSVVVPVYNVETYLTECVDSIVGQTYGNLELLLIDDGSKDSSGEICDDYAAKDHRVRVIHKENGGVSSARNLGIDQAQGEYLVFVDSDDRIDPTMVEKMVNAITRYRTDLVICGYERFRDDWSQAFRISAYSTIIFQNLSELAGVYTAAGTNMFGVSIWAKMYNLQIIRQNSISFREDISYEEDCVFNLDYFNHVQYTCVLNECLYSYRQMDQSLSKGYRRDSYRFLVNGYRGRMELLQRCGLNTKGAENILVIVIKNTFIKIYDSSLTMEEKLQEYAHVMSFEESVQVCSGASGSKSRLTRNIAGAVVKQDPRRVHSILKSWKAIVNLKAVVKRIIGRDSK